MITLETELRRIRGLSESFLKKLEKLEIATVRDILFHFPARYDDFSRVIPIAELLPHQSATVRGFIQKVNVRRTWRRHMALVEATITDATGGIKAIWFNQPYIAKILREGEEINLAGKVSAGKNEGIYFSNPAYEPVRRGGELKHTAGLIPVYPETKGLTSRGIRYLVKPLLSVVPFPEEIIPEEILAKEKLPAIGRALNNIHFPHTPAEADAARRRFAFEDLFLLQLRNLLFRHALSKEHAPRITLDKNDFNEMLSALPFSLTFSQTKSIEETLRDLESGRPMNRLLQGDVGSGKTVVAAVAALAAARAGYQSSFMAPTEILARQHFHTFEKLYAPLMKRWNITTTLLTGGLSAKEKRAAARAIQNGEIQIAIGTHALIEGKIQFKNLALVVIDEQHRFGVEQRKKLLKNGGEENSRPFTPHFLSMSATPIPRTLALTVFGDLDLSLINELPAGRKPIITKIVDPENRAKAYAFARARVKEGRQIFVICPRIEQSTNEEKLITDNGKFTEGNESSVIGHKLSVSNRWSETKTVSEEFEKLSKQIFPDLRLAMLHGKMRSAEKERIMADFKTGATDILVSTSVIEVGVDIPNASLMIIEGAEYFGLAQLYQFRGRIGRGAHQSYCLLFSESESASVRERLTALLNAKNGFELAERDLAIRGPGEFLGEKQTGLPDMAMRALSNIALIKKTRDAAEITLANDPILEHRPFLRERLALFESKIHLE